MKNYDCVPTADFNKCKGAKFFSNFNLRSRFWQIPLLEKDRKYTPFLCKNNCYHYNRVTFGLTTTSAVTVKYCYCRGGNVHYDISR